MKALKLAYPPGEHELDGLRFNLSEPKFWTCATRVYSSTIFQRKEDHRALRDTQYAATRAGEVLSDALLGFLEVP